MVFGDTIIKIKLVSCASVELRTNKAKLTTAMITNHPYLITASVDSMRLSGLTCKKFKLCTRVQNYFLAIALSLATK